MFDNDQYLLVFHVPTGAGTSSLTNYLVGAVTAAGGTIPVNAAGGTFEQY
jgi:ABC-type transport system involved in cytochrome bd biosynthesis fused ATPase/permease subunit